jgi:pseudouridine-5'-phosphate glycosidase
VSERLPIELAAEIAEAAEAGAPVVALESTILAHGFPPAERRPLAAELEAEVRAHGAVPATIAIIDGAIRVGLDDSSLERITAADAQVAKAAAVDVAYHLARRSLAATTVSATLLGARLAGIRVFATGGIGGVHRGDGSDVSSDLLELARSPVAVVSAGAKSILDLPRTLETLETFGVLVVGYRTDRFPAFYVRDSGLPVPHRSEHPHELAAMARLRFEELGQGGMLVCNPIASEHALDSQVIGAHIDEAIAAAEASGVRGKELTPFLLSRLSEVTDGRSVASNRALALGNARLAAQIAAAYSRG